MTEDQRVHYGAIWNEPSFLLAWVLRLQGEGVLPEEMRILPHIGHITQPEIVSRPLSNSAPPNSPDDRLHWLYLNVRPENRLRWLYPFLRQGPGDETAAQSQEPEQDAELQRPAEQKAAQLWNELFAPNLEPNQQELERLERHRWLIDCNPEWIERLGFLPTANGWVQPGYMTPVQWLARLWRALYPQLTPVPLQERPHPDRLRLVGSKLVREPNPNQTIQARDDEQAGRLRDEATLLAEKFFTLMFLHLASIEMLEGVAYPMDWALDSCVNPCGNWLGEECEKFEQNGLLGGIELDSVLLRLMQDWAEEDSFLGLTCEEWNLFDEPAEQGILWMLLLKRRDIMDYGTLFERSVRLLISERADVHLEAYRKVDSRLGTPLAQLGLSLAVEGEAILRAPEVIVYLPHDAPNAPEAKRAQQRLEILRRLFLPAHIPLRCRWAVDVAVLGETAWLDDGDAPLTREGVPLQSYSSRE